MVGGPHFTRGRTTTLIVGKKRGDGSDSDQKDENPHAGSDPLRQELRFLDRFPLTALFVFRPATAGAGIVTTYIRRFHDHATACHPRKRSARY